MTPNPTNDGKHNRDIELFVLVQFVTALVGFCSMLVILTPPLLTYDRPNNKGLLTVLTCASFIVIELSAIVIAYDLTKSIYIAIALVPGFLIVVAYLAIDFYKQDEGREAIGDDDNKMMDVWVFLGGVNFTGLAVVYGQYSNNLDTPGIIKNFVNLTATAFVCCLIHMLMELLRPRRNGQGIGRKLFFRTTIVFHMIVMLSLLLVLLG